MPVVKFTINACAPRKTTFYSPLNSCPFLHILLKLSVKSHSLENPVRYQRKGPMRSYTYRQLLRRHSSFRHIVFSHSKLRSSSFHRRFRGRFVEKGFTLFLRRYVPLKKLEELVTEDDLDPFDCLGAVPPIGRLDQKGVRRGIMENRTNSHTSHSSLRSSSLALSIICFSISSWMSHSWNAAVSVLSRAPSKICENLKSSM